MTSTPALPDERMTGLERATNDDLITQMLPVLGRSLDIGFNVFDVMHHGTHEKQLSNVFRWFFEIGGTHNFNALGQQLFIEQIFQHSDLPHDFAPGTFTVRQEVNTSEPGEAEDIADLVLENDTAVIVVENYETSDGHGHSYDRYLRFSQRGQKKGIVVLLCVEEHRSHQTQGWEHAPVVTYEQYLDRLMQELDNRPKYALQNPEQHAFISQMHRKYARGKGRMSDREVLDFVTAMCATGEAKRYQTKNRDLAAERFASDIAQQARERFEEGREVLLRVRRLLRAYGDEVLRVQVNTTLGAEVIGGVSSRYVGIYHWTINFEPSDKYKSLGNPIFQIKFGPSAWFANVEPGYFKGRVDPELADYSYLFLTNGRSREIWQSPVSLHEIIDGLASNDERLHDEIIPVFQTS